MFNDKDLKSNLDIIIRKLEVQNYEQDNEQIGYLSNELKKLGKKLPTMESLEKIHKILTNLEIKYDEYNDLSYYFNPVYVSVKKIIHQEVVQKLKLKHKKREN